VDPNQPGEIGKYSRLVTDNVHSDLSSRKRKDMSGNNSSTPAATPTATKGEQGKGRRKGDAHSAEPMDVQGGGDTVGALSESDCENADSLRVKELKLYVLLKILNKFEVTSCPSPFTSLCVALPPPTLSSRSILRVDFPFDFTCFVLALYLYQKRSS
jgi:hypothetical protein